MEIRPYRPGDQQAILLLQRNADVDLSAVVPDSFYDDLHDIEATYEGGAFLVAAAGSAIVGMGGLLATGEVVRIRVDAAYRRRGIGSSILVDLLRRARVLSMDRVFLHTLVQQDAAQHLYLAHGFRETGRGSIRGNRVIAYERLLGW